MVLLARQKKAKYVTKWEVEYHKILSINVFCILTCSNLGSCESSLHHELVENYLKIYKSRLRQVHEFLITKTGNDHKP